MTTRWLLLRCILCIIVVALCWQLLRTLCPACFPESPAQFPKESALPHSSSTKPHNIDHVQLSSQDTSKLLNVPAQQLPIGLPAAVETPVQTDAPQAMPVTLHLTPPPELRIDSTNNTPDAEDGNDVFALPSSDVKTLQDVLKKLHRDRPVVVALSNGQFVDMTLNFVCSLKRLAMENYIILADDEAHAKFQQYNVCSVPVSGISSWKWNQYGGNQFSAICRARIKVIGYILSQGFDVVWLDTDIVILRDFTTLLLSAAKKDAVPIDGHYTIGRVVGPLQPGLGWDYAINYYVNHSNAAFYFLRSNDRTVRFMNNWNQCIKKVSNKKADDQDILNFLVDADLTFQRAHRLKTYGIPEACAGLQVHLRRLLLESGTHFASGYHYFGEQLPQKAGIVPFLIHNNQVRKTEVKVTRWKRAGLWFLEYGTRKCRTDIPFTTSAPLDPNAAPNPHAKHARNQENG